MCTSAIGTTAATAAKQNRKQQRALARSTGTLAAARAGQGKAMATPAIRRPTTAPQWRTDGSKWLQCRVRAFFVPKGNVDVFSIDGAVISWMRAQDNWGLRCGMLCSTMAILLIWRNLRLLMPTNLWSGTTSPAVDAERRAQAWRQRERRWAAQKKALESKKNKSSDAIASVANKSDTGKTKE